MRGIFTALMGVLVITSWAAFVPYRQAPEANIVVLDRSGTNIDHLVDGNQIKLQVTISGPSLQDQAVTFSLSEDGELVASCIVLAGNRSCTAGPVLTLGWYWNQPGTAQPARVIQALDANRNIIGRSSSISIAPRPVVMVHGFVSSWETWKPYLGPDGLLASIGLQGFAIGDGQVRGRLNTGRITDPAGKTNTIQQNAEILGRYIAGVKQKTGAEMVDLVVHSMGGMIARYYIDRVMQERDVAQLIMLGSPMGGSDCSVLPASLGFYLPASLEIRSSYMLGIFNQQITHRNGIRFYDLAGTAILQPYESPCTSVPNDTVVSLGSINAIPLDSRQFNIIHSDLTVSPEVFEQFVRPLLQNAPDQFTPVSEPAPAGPAGAPLQFTRLYRGHVDPGGSTELTVNIEQNLSVASFALYDPTRSTDVSVRGASGNIIELDPQKNGFIRIEDPASMFYLGYGFSNPKPGPWKVTVLATDKTPASGADFVISVYFVGGAELQATSSTLIPSPGETVKITAKLALGGQPVQIQQGQALIRHPDGNVETLEMQPGLQASVDWTPEVPGVYGADIVITAQGPDNSTIERTAFLSIEVQPNPSRTKVQTNLFALGGSILLVVGLLLFLISRAIRFFARSRR